jgi:orotate phosphoribosyltransferase
MTFDFGPARPGDPKLRSDLHFNRIQKEIANFVKENCIHHANPPMLGKAAGTRYTSQFYFAALTHNGRMLNNICESFHYLTAGFDPVKEKFQVAGYHWSSLPILGALSAFYRGNLNAFSIRRNRKEYGLHNIIEGKPNNLPVLLIDDLANSTNSFARSQQILIDSGIPVLDSCFAIMNKKNQTDDQFLWDRYSDQKIMSIISRDMVI